MRRNSSVTPGLRVVRGVPLKDARDGAEARQLELRQQLSIPVQLTEPTPSIDIDEETPRSMADGLSERFPPGAIVANKYRIVRLLSSGGMGCVFLAEQLPLGRQTALKLMYPDLDNQRHRKRFFLEASICSKLSHRNVVTVFDYGEHETGELFIAMEFIPGRPLSEAIRHKAGIEPERALLYTKQVARALVAAHALGVIHRDLKPSNVMVVAAEGGRDSNGVKVLDFGTSKILDDEDAERDVALTQAGMIVGSPLYMAPEQILRQPLGPETDIYTLGALLFEMLTAQPPFPGTDMAVIYDHVHTDVPSVVELRPELAAWPRLEPFIRRCLAKKPSHRFGSAREVLAALEQVEKAPDAPPEPPLPEKQKSRPSWLGYAGAFCVGVALSGVFVWVLASQAAGLGS